MEEGLEYKGEKITVYRLMEKLVIEMCDKYCKYPGMFVKKDPYTGLEVHDDDGLYEGACKNCPLNILG